MVGGIISLFFSDTIRINKIFIHARYQKIMNEREKRALMTSFHRSSIAGSAVISFALMFIVLYYSGLSVINTAFISAVFSVIIVLARSRSKL